MSIERLFAVREICLFGSGMEYNSFYNLRFRQQAIPMAESDEI